MKIKITTIFICSIFLSHVGLSQFTINSINKKERFEFIQFDNHVINDSVLDSWYKGFDNCVIFFCPNTYGMNEYIDHMDNLLNSDVYGAIENLKTIFVYYPFSTVRSKNPYISNSGLLKDSIIDELNCFVFTSSEKLLKRSIGGVYSDFNFIKDKQRHLYKLGINENFVCPKDIPARVALFQEPISEIFNPNYSVEERISFLEEKNKAYESEITSLLNELELLKFEIRKMNDCLLELEQDQLLNDQPRKRK
jgi:hypothetical protein